MGISIFRGEEIICKELASSSGGRQKPGPADLLKTISMGLIADGLIFKGLTGPFRLVTGYSAIAPGE
jgi:hypothetical protein